MKKPARQSGAAIVEFSLVFMLFLVLCMGLFEMGRAMWIYTTLSHAVRQGARFAMVRGAGAMSPVTPATNAEITQVVRNNAIGFGCKRRYRHSRLETLCDRRRGRLGHRRREQKRRHLCCGSGDISLAIHYGQCVHRRQRLPELGQCLEHDDLLLTPAQAANLRDGQAARREAPQRFARSGCSFAHSMNSSTV